MTSSPVGTVSDLYRYPVKSMLGEQLERADVTERGIAATGHMPSSTTKPAPKFGAQPGICAIDLVTSDPPDINSTLQRTDDILVASFGLVANSVLAGTPAAGPGRRRAPAACCGHDGESAPTVQSAPSASSQPTQSRIVV